MIKTLTKIAMVAVGLGAASSASAYIEWRPLRADVAAQPAQDSAQSSDSREYIEWRPLRYIEWRPL